MYSRDISVNLCTKITTKISQVSQWEWHLELCFIYTYICKQKITCQTLRMLRMTIVFWQLTITTVASCVPVFSHQCEWPSLWKSITWCSIWTVVFYFFCKLTRYCLLVAILFLHIFQVPLLSYVHRLNECFFVFVILQVYPQPPSYTHQGSIRVSSSMGSSTDNISNEESSKDFRKCRLSLLY